MEADKLRTFIELCLEEDIGDGDHSSIASIPPSTRGKAKLLIKEKGILAGMRAAELVFSIADASLRFDKLLEDGAEIKPGDVAFYISGNLRSILRTERLVLNIIQRMSGIATVTRNYVSKLNGLNTILLDTRKTSPGMRMLEKEAVRIGGAQNHRMGLFDMIMLKDNHIDYSGGIENAIASASAYIKSSGKKLRIEIEARSLDDVRKIISNGGVDRIMLDNFSIGETREAVKLIASRFETESSGGISIENIRQYAECGVDYISVGALTHHLKSLDMSLKAIKEGA